MRSRSFAFSATNTSPPSGRCCRRSDWLVSERACPERAVFCLNSARGLGAICCTRTTPLHSEPPPQDRFQLFLWPFFPICHDNVTKMCRVWSHKELASTSPPTSGSPTFILNFNFYEFLGTLTRAERPFLDTYWTPPCFVILTGKKVEGR